MKAKFRRSECFRGKDLAWKWTKAVFAIFSCGLFSIALPVHTVKAQTLTTLYHFPGASGDGYNPWGGMVADSAGNLYGTTYAGGPFNNGTVFKIDASGNETVLHSFSGADGAQPWEADLILDSAGKLYGTTYGGGDYGFGTVFTLTTSGAGFAVLHSFSGNDGGSYPRAGLVADSSGYLYGSTQDGGAAGSVGTVFKLAKDGTGFAVLHSFMSNDGTLPAGSLILDSANNLYGTTWFGGPNGLGTVFRLDTSGGGFTVLHGFPAVFNGIDGSSPDGPLTLGPDGTIYGATRGGGALNGGVLFKLSASGSNYGIVHDFWPNSDGVSPHGGLILDSAGFLNGTVPATPSSAGTVFSIPATPPGIDTQPGGLSPDGFRVLYSFSGGATDEGHPQGDLTRDSAGNLYGTTYGPGAESGTVFKFEPDRTPPVITPQVFGAAGNNGWYLSNVSVNWSVMDNTAIVSETGCDVTFVPYDTPGVTTACTATSQGGTGSQSVTLKVDSTPPAISISSPTATTYLVNQAVANYTCGDGLSGLASCTGPVANGATIQNAKAGPNAFIVNATDNAGNKSSATVYYTVNYNFSGFQPPVNNAPTVNTGKAGRTYPVKWQLSDAKGNYIGTLSAVTSVTYQPTACGAFTNDPSDPLEATTTGSSGLGYDGNQYHYNWASPATAGCYTLFLTLDSGQIFPAYFNLN